MSVLIKDGRVLTLAEGARPRRGGALGVLAAIDGCDVRIEGDRIVEVGCGLGADGVDRVVEAHGRVVMPAFVDAHTHACWAGDRLDEWELKQKGASYLELLEAGGGIMSTVRCVREASEAALGAHLLERLDHMLAEGTCTVEIKSGYGLSTDDELKMLRAIAIAARAWAGTVSMTACIGHAVDGAHKAFVERTIHETLDAVHDAFPEATIDAYCEQGAWGLDDCIRLFERAKELGHCCRVHADQFNALGMTPAAIKLGLRSVDHLEATHSTDLRALAESSTFGVMLPCSGFQVDGRYADGRGFVDVGGALVMATNCNPGSAPCSSMPMAIALAVRELGLTTAEAIGACTANAASLLGMGDRGTIEEGARADVIVLRHRDERMLGYEFGGRAVDVVVCGGVVRD
ncbi:MAG: imidazolonepropionase [Phycisphaerales bacterium]